MDWRIVLKTCSALNASWALKFALCAIVKDFRPPNSSASRGGKRPRLPPMYILSGPEVPMYSFLRKVVQERVNGCMRTVKTLNPRLNIMRKASDIQVNYLFC